MDEGTRLEQFVRLRWTRRKGGIRALAEVIGTSPDTVYRWFNGTSPIDTYYLGRLAEALGVRRWEIVAAMDDDEAVPFDETGQERLRELVERLLDERVGPRRSTHGARPGASG